MNFKNHNSFYQRNSSASRRLICRFMLSVLALFICTASAEAAVHHWIGSTSPLWREVGNWEFFAAPPINGNGDNVGILIEPREPALVYRTIALVDGSNNPISVNVEVITENSTYGEVSIWGGTLGTQVIVGANSGLLFTNKVNLLSNPLTIQGKVRFGAGSSFGFGDASTFLSIGDTTGGVVTSVSMEVPIGNTFLGDIVIEEGSYTMGGSGNGLADSTRVTINGAGHFIVNDPDNIGGLAGGSANGKVSLNQNLTVGLDNTSTTFSGAITGSGVFGKAGTGTLTLTGANTHSGATVISGGTLRLGDGTGGGSIANDITNNSNLEFNLFGTSHVYSGNISGTGSVKHSQGAIELTGAITHSGGTTISGGTFSIGGGGTTGSIAGDINMTNLNASLAFDRSDDDLIYDGVISGGGALIKNGGGTVTLTGGNTYTGLTKIFGGTLQIGSGGTTGSIAGDITSFLGNGTVIFNRSNSLIYNGEILGDVTFIKQGAGTLTLTGDNTYSGVTHIKAGTLVATGANERIPQVNPVRIDEGAAFRVDGITESIEGIQNFAGSIFLDNAATLQLLPDTFNRVFPGTITGADDTTLAILGGAKFQRLRSANPDFFGTARVDGSFFQLAHADALQNATVQLNSDNGLDIDEFSLDANLGGLAGAGNLDIGNQTVSVGANGRNTTYSGELFGGGGTLVKNGNGILTLTGANTYSGGTIVDEGTLLANNSTGSATGTGDVTVNSGATLGGTGSIDGSINVNSGGSIAPGVSPGQLTVGSVDFDSGSQFVVELAGSGGVAGTDFDQLLVNNTATINAGSTLDVAFDGNFTPNTGDLFPILTASNITGTFDNENLPAGYAWSIDYNATSLSLEVLALLGDMDGNDLVNAADVPLFVQALVDRAAYEVDFPLLDANLIGDVNQNGTFDLGDVAAFKALFSGSASAQSVPEPGSFVLLAAGALLLITRNRRLSRRRRI